MLLTARGTNANDTFVVSAREVTTTGFKVNIYRVDTPGASWTQNLLVDWWASQ
jgi:hypothetical protein